MLNRLLSGVIVVAFSFLFANPAASNNIFVPSVGLEYRFIGGTWVQNDTRTKLDFSVIMGGAVNLDAIAVGGHRIGLGVAYLGHVNAEKKGTAQINVRTKRQQTDFNLVYRYHWNFICLSLAAGASMGIISVTTSIYNLGTPSTSADSENYIFEDKTLTDEDKSVGLSWGPTILSEVGLDVGRVAARGRGRFDNFLFFNLSVQYAERDRKNELLFWGSFSIYPMVIWNNKK